MRRCWTPELLAAVLLSTVVLAGTGSVAVARQALTPSDTRLLPVAQRSRPAGVVTLRPALGKKGPKRPGLTAGTIDGSAYEAVLAGKLIVAGLDTRGIVASSDGGVRWRAENAGLPAGDATVISLSFGAATNRLFALVHKRVYSTAPRLPFAWSPWGAPLPRTSVPQALAYWPPAHAVLAGDGEGHLYLANAANAAWTAADTGLPVGRSAITTLLVSNGALFAGTTNGLATSVDGRSWRLDGGFGGHQANRIALLPRGGLAVAIDTGGLVVRPDAGSSWHIVADTVLGLPAGERVLSVAYVQSTGDIYFGTLDRGVLELRPDGGSRRLSGVQDGNPVNGLLPAGQWLIASTNAGLRRIPIV